MVETNDIKQFDGIEKTIVDIENLPIKPKWLPAITIWVNIDMICNNRYIFYHSIWFCTFWKKAPIIKSTIKLVINIVTRMKLHRALFWLGVLNAISEVAYRLPNIPNNKPAKAAQ